MNGYQINKFMFFICDHCLSNFHISKGKGKVQLTASVVGSQSESHSQANQTLTTDITVMLLLPQRPFCCFKGIQEYFLQSVEVWIN